MRTGLRDRRVLLWDLYDYGGNPFHSRTSMGGPRGDGFGTGVRRGKSHMPVTSREAGESTTRLGDRVLNKRRLTTQRQAVRHGGMVSWTWKPTPKARPRETSF